MATHGNSEPATANGNVEDSTIECPFTVSGSLQPPGEDAINAGDRLQQASVAIP
jgi:hypothetical protein